MDTTLLVYWYEKRIQFIFMTLNAVINEFMFTLRENEQGWEGYFSLPHKSTYFTIKRFFLGLQVMIILTFYLSIVLSTISQSPK